MLVKYLSITALLGSTLLFGSVPHEVVDIKPQRIFVPNGFDDNDQVEVVTDGYLPDTCYRLRPTVVVVDVSTKKISIQPKADIFEGVCLDVTVPFTTVVPIATGVPSGTYEIAAYDGSLKQSLFVAPAPTTTPDQYTYAPVEKVSVKNTALGAHTAILSGRYTNTCSVTETIKVTVTGQTLQVLPIMKQLEKDPMGNPCAAQERAFEEKVTLPKLATGRYLLHVRSLNGNSVNEVFNSGI